MSNTKQQSDISLVIQKHLQGKSMNQISNGSGISKGKVHYVITDWKKKLALSDINEIRNFITLCTKSNMSVEQCAQGFRITNILNNLGIKDDDDDDGCSKDFAVNNQYNELSTFLQDIYLICKNLGVTPSHISLWIKDLHDFHSKSKFNIDRSPALLEKDDMVYDKKPIASPIISTASFHSHNNKLEDAPNIDDNYNTKPNAISKLKDDFHGQIKIPFTSQVSLYISQKKQEYSKLEIYQKNLEDNIKNLEIQKNTITDKLDQLYKKEKFALSHIKWFYNLEKALWESYSIKIKDDIQSFSQLFNDFKEHGYDASIIIQEYLKSLSIKLEIKTHEADISRLSLQRASLNNSVLSLESQVDIHKQTLDRYSRLEAMNFGLKELNQLWLTILEIARANNIPSDEAVSKFLKDIDEQYDNKLGFESKVQEKKSELFHLKNQLNSDRLAIQLQPSIVPTLQNLFQNGVIEEDIINMNHLITKFAKNSFSLNIHEDNNISKDKKDNNLIINTNNYQDRTKYWKTFIDQLEKLHDIKSSIKEQMENQNKIQKEVFDLNKQKQEISVQCQNAVSLIYTINNKISYFKGFMDYYNKNQNNKVNLSSKISAPVPIFIIYNNTGKDKEDKENRNK
ncbi:MAG: hypothetical protein M3Z01_02345 [Thermoproteota archaeon]|nr:hypothetical protein [Thermoproteota archaeon]